MVNCVNMVKLEMRREYTAALTGQNNHIYLYDVLCLSFEDLKRIVYPTSMLFQTCLIFPYFFPAEHKCVILKNVNTKDFGNIYMYFMDKQNSETFLKTSYFVST